MNAERGRGAVLHLLAALILVAGAMWWWRAAPREPVDDRLLDWRLTAEQLLPDSGDLQTSGTVAVTEDGHEEVAEVGGGEFLVSVVCAGEDGSRVRVSLGARETGRGLRCSGERTPEVFSVGLANELHLRVNVEKAGPVVFRYTLQRVSS
ncbi:DUF6023 family protein [Actinoplanes sp. NPDC023936]|uniref:DUF6023 family protein n=1 Tax=Actinoplanes sp. NPDC023936 TaxID=3154910 RepID=UPI0033C4FB74